CLHMDRSDQIERTYRDGNEPESCKNVKFGFHSYFPSVDLTLETSDVAAPTDVRLHPASRAFRFRISSVDRSFLRAARHPCILNRAGRFASCNRRICHARPSVHRRARDRKQWPSSKRPLSQFHVKLPRVASWLDRASRARRNIGPVNSSLSIVRLDFPWPFVI